MQSPGAGDGREPGAPAPATASPSAPHWMEATAPESRKRVRTGAASAPKKGGSSLVFFGLITLAVGAAGILGITYFGPEKESRASSHLASNPPKPLELPSLPAEDVADAGPAVVAAPEPPAPGASASSVPPASTKPAKHGARKGGRSKAH